MTATIRALIVDDEPLARQAIRGLLSADDEIAVVCECRDGAEAIDAVRSLRPALLFLDVQMPGLNGFDVVREIAADEAVPAIIFVTAYDEFAVRAFETEALDYLVKPFSDARFARARDRAVAAIVGGATGAAMTRARAAAGKLTARYLDRILVRSGTRSIVVATDTIDWISADDYYARLHVGSRSHLVRTAMNRLEERLNPQCFFRTHRSAIVNISRVIELRRAADGHHDLVLMGGAIAPVSERRYERVAAELGWLSMR